MNIKKLIQYKQADKKAIKALLQIQKATRSTFYNNKQNKKQLEKTKEKLTIALYILTAIIITLNLLTN
jgi:hypothetical protein